MTQNTMQPQPQPQPQPVDDPAVDGVPAAEQAVSVLVLDGHATAAGASVQSLGRSGYAVYAAAATADVIAFQSRYARERFEYPDPQVDRQAFVAWLSALSAERGFDFILPITDATIHPLMEADAAGISGELILPPAAAFPYAFDKDRTVELAREAGVPVPRSQRLTEMPADLSALGRFPLYLKPVTSKAWHDGRGANLAPRLVQDETALAAELGQLLRYVPVLVQEYVPGYGVGVELLCDRGETVLAFAHQRVHEYPLTGGRSTYRKSIALPQPLTAAASRLLGAIGWHGVAMVEFKYDGRDFWLMEINGRFWGSLPLAMYAGVDFPVALLDLYAHGRRWPQPRYRVGVYARSLTADINWLRANLTADRSDPLLMTRGVLTSLVELLRVLIGRECWDHFQFSDPWPGWWQVKTIVRDMTAKIRDGISRQLQLRIAGRRSRRRAAATPVKRLLVLCYGNIYRSPFVERWLAQALAGDVEVRSAGFHPREDRPCEPGYAAICREYGVDLGDHRSMLLDRGQMAWADLIVLMDWKNHRDLSTQGRLGIGKSVWLGAFGSRSQLEIPDPYGEDEETAREVVTQMIGCCQGLVACLSTADRR